MPRTRPTTPQGPNPPGPPHPHPACLDDTALLQACHWGRGRASGPGGQHRNKVETLVWITHLPTGIEAHAGERRSAEENKREAIFRLRLALATEYRSAPPKGDAWGDARSSLWKSRVSKEGAIACNPSHTDFPSMLAEALDNLAASGMDERKAALRLSCTPSQLVKLIKEHTPAWVAVNRVRAELGRHPLR